MPFDPATLKYDAAGLIPCVAQDHASGEVLMVGDTYEADCLGPRRVGMHAIHLARNLASPDPRFLRSLSDLPSYLARQAPPSVPQ